MSLKTCNIELGALTNVPIWEDHKRGKNWFAKISKDPKAPGGLGREFAAKAHREYYYMLLKEWGIGTPIEFGADYYSGSGNPSRSRWYGYISRSEENEVVFEHTETASQAIKQGKELVDNLATNTKEPKRIIY